MRLVSATLVLAALVTVPAQANFSVCNKAAHATSVAIGRFNGRHWISEGWWKISPGTCAKMVPGPLDARYYYLYANDGGSGTWDGSTAFCTAATGRFSIAGRGKCSGRGFDRRGFFQVDTGQSPNWTQTLSD